MKVIPLTARGIALRISVKNCTGYSNVVFHHTVFDRDRYWRTVVNRRVIQPDNSLSRGYIAWYKLFLKIHKRKAPASLRSRSRQWGKGPSLRESCFSYTGLHGKNGWSMQSGVTEGKGGLVMTRDLFVDLTLFVQKSKYSAVESHKGGPFPRTFPGIIHLPKRKGRREKR